MRCGTVGLKNEQAAAACVTVARCRSTSTNELVPDHKRYRPCLPVGVRPVGHGSVGPLRTRAASYASIYPYIGT